MTSFQTNAANSTNASFSEMNLLSTNEEIGTDELFTIDPLNNLVDTSSNLQEQRLTDAIAAVEQELQQETTQASASLDKIRRELHAAGSLKKTDIQHSVDRLAQLIEGVHQGVKGHLSDVMQQKFESSRRYVQHISHRLRQTKDVDQLLQIATTATKQFLSVDRVVVYRFEGSDRGQVLMEALESGWTPMITETLPALCFGESRRLLYQQQSAIVIHDLEKLAVSPYHFQLAERYQIKASLAVPIWIGSNSWGLLVAQQCSQPRQWQEIDILFMTQIAAELSPSIQHQVFLTQQQQWINQGNVLSAIINQIYQSPDVDNVFRITTEEVRRQIQCDRVVIYKFNPDWSGQFIAESVGSGWKPLMQEQQDNPILRQNISKCTVQDLVQQHNSSSDTYLKETSGGKFTRGEIYRVCHDIHAAGFTPCYIQMLERYQAQAYITVAIYDNDKLWGLLAAYQCNAPRQWTDAEVGMLGQVGVNLNLALQQANKTDQLNAAMQREKAIGGIINRILQASDLTSVLQTITRELRQLIQCDRVVLYKFYPDWSGEIVAESVVSGWKSLLQEQDSDNAIRTSLMASEDCVVKTYGVPSNRDQDTYLKETKGSMYNQGVTFRQVDDIYKAGFSPCYLESLENRFQARAYINAPIFNQGQLWGLLAVYQCSGARAWTEDETKALVEIARPLGLALQQAEKTMQLRSFIEREQALSKIGNQILTTTDDPKTLYHSTVRSVRRYLNADRVGIFAFYPDSGYDDGEFIAENVVGEFPSAIAIKIHDHCFGKQFADKYAQGRIQAVADIYNANLSDCHIEVLSQFEIRANLIIPLLNGDELWGLLCVHQCRGPREWQSEEIDFLRKIADQLSLAYAQSSQKQALQQQAQTLAETSDRTLAYNRLVSRIAQRVILQIQQGDTAYPVFRLAVQDMRQQLHTDRVAIYQFHPDWSGEFICEDVGVGYPRLVGSELGKVRDSYLQETKGGRYKDGESFRVNDIFSAGHSDCHIELIKTWSVRAYMLAPIFTGDTLWGIIGAYQNDGPRQWQDYELELLGQVGVQLGIAVQQASSDEQLRQQAAEIAKAAERNKEDKDKLQQQIVQMLMAVRPALNGDLTVRAPVTEDAVGTIADAYNNTIQSLRQLVTQVKDATTNVSQTSQDNGAAIALLSQQTQTALQQITQALEQVQSMVESTQSVAYNAQQVETAVQQANQTVQRGDTAMNQTVEGILMIRETVSEATKKIKRLSESSQKISKVVSLISNFTTQTQLLAMNAAIEATRAGDYGRGFAVVADEVRSLAQQSSEATTEIETLVQEIQSETGAVSTAMDMGIQQVVAGTNLVTQTRQSLNEIVAATVQIRELIQGITSSTQAQTQQSQAMTQAMNEVAAIAQKTSADSTRIAQSFQNLLTTAETLQTSVGQFKVD